MGRCDKQRITLFMNMSTLNNSSGLILAVNCIILQLSRSSTTRSDHYRTPQAAATPVIDAQRFSTLTQGTIYGSARGSTGYGSLHTPSSNYSAVQTAPSSNYSTLQACSNYSAMNAPRDMMPLPPPQLASVAQYRLSTNSLGEYFKIFLSLSSAPTLSSTAKIHSGDYNAGKHFLNGSHLIVLFR